MKPRKTVGTKNSVGQTVVALRKECQMRQKDLLIKLQVYGIDIGVSSLSDLEGQNRSATDRELRALAEIFGVPIEELYNKENTPEA